MAGQKSRKRRMARRRLDNQRRADKRRQDIRIADDQAYRAKRRNEDDPFIIACLVIFTIAFVLLSIL